MGAKNLGRDPLSEGEPTVAKTFKAPASLWEQAKKHAEGLGFRFLGEFVRFAIQQEIWRDHDERVIQQLNELKNENIRLRDIIKSRKREEK